MERRALLLVALSGLCITAHCAVVVVDSTQNSYLTGSTHSRIGKAELQAIVAALTGLQPATGIDSAASQQIALVVKPSPFKKPQVHFSVNVAGVTAEELVGLFAGRNQATVQLDGDEHVADAMMDVFTGLAATNPEVSFQLLEQLATQKCQDGKCVERLMPVVAEAIDGEYSSASHKLTLNDGTELDLHQLVDKAFATELVSALAGVQSFIQGAKQHGPQDIAVLDMTMLGLQGLTGKYGQGSAEAVAGRNAVLSILDSVVQQLESQYKGDVTVQVGVFDKAPIGGEDALEAFDDMLKWKGERHSRMLQGTPVTQTTTYPPADEAAAAKIFSAKAAGYGGFILLLYFMLGGIYCLCNMPFKKDSLLYGSKKTE